MTTGRLGLVGALVASVHCSGVSAPPPSTAPVTVTATVAHGDGEAASTPEPNAERRVGDLHGDFERCYRDALALDPKIAGVIVLVVAIDGKGVVKSVATKGGTSLPPHVINCLYARVESARFDAPGGSGSTFTIPVTLRSP